MIHGNHESQECETKSALQGVLSIVLQCSDQCHYIARLQLCWDVYRSLGILWRVKDKYHGVRNVAMKSEYWCIYDRLIVH